MAYVIYDAIYSFFSGSVWGVNNSPPFTDGRTFKNWIDGHTVLSRIVMSRIVSVVEELNGSEQFPDSVVIVAMFRIRSVDAYKLLQAIRDEQGFIHRMPIYHVVNEDTIAGRVKRRRLRRIN
eukprot:scaffold40976_cov60-Cyclotella_meneghiniana.AAC.5